MPKLRIVALVLLAAVVGLIALSAGRSWREVRAISGLTVADGPGGAVVASVRTGGPAEAAGVMPGDLLIEISGTPVASALVAADALTAVDAGGAAGLRLVRDGVTLTTEIRTRRAVVWHRDRIVGGFVALLFAIGGLAALIRPRASKSTLVYAAWCVAGASVLGVGWSTRARDIDWALFWIDRFARLLFPALWVHLVLTVGRIPDARRRAWLPFVYAPAVALLVAEIQIVGLGSALAAPQPRAFVDLLQSRVEMIWIALGLATGIALLLPRARAALQGGRSIDAAPAKWLLTGALAGFVPFLVLIALPLVVTGSASAAGWLALPALAIVPLAFTPAVIEYRLMDLALFGRRTLVVSATLASSLVLFLGLLSVAEWGVSRIVHPPGIVPVLVAALGTAALAPAIRAGARELVSRLYYRRRYSFRRALQRFARELNAELDLPNIQDVLAERIREALDIAPVELLLVRRDGALARAADDALHGTLPDGVRDRLAEGKTIFLADVAAAPERLFALHNGGIEALVPLRVEEKLIAILAVGPRRGGGLLDSDDIDLLKYVAAHASAAVAGAISLERLREQVRLVEKLQARTESLIDSSPIGMAVVDDGGAVRHWNPSLATLLGRPASEALDGGYERVLPPALHPHVRRALASGGDGVGVRAFRVRVPRPEGKELLLNFSATPLVGPDGPDGLLLSLDDVTDQARLEQQLIQQDRLASVGMLAAGVAHEVNTPLTGISSYAQIILDDAGTNDPRRPVLEKIVAQADRASRIARGLLSISRPGGSEGVALGPVDLHDLAEETVGLLAPQIRRAGTTVTVDSPGDPVVASADRPRLQQVVMNLLLNALDAVEGGGEVTLRAKFDGAGHPCLEVQDNGVGIPDEVRNKMFDPFFTTKERGRGTGLGLSISYAIVREHGGRLEVTSEPGRGTLLRIRLPRATRDAAALQAS